MSIYVQRVQVYVYLYICVRIERGEARRRNWRAREHENCYRGTAGAAVAAPALSLDEVVVDCGREVFIRAAALDERTDVLSRKFLRGGHLAHVVASYRGCVFFCFYFREKGWTFYGASCARKCLIFFCVGVFKLEFLRHPNECNPMCDKVTVLYVLIAFGYSGRLIFLFLSYLIDIISWSNIMSLRYYAL